MYQIGETVWAIINMFDIPKKVKIKGIEYGDNASSIVTIKYRVQYKMKEFINPLPENPVLQGGDVEARNQIV